MVDNSRAVKRVLVYVLFLNWAVSASKMIYGYMTGSVGMLSDGFHSLFDGMSNIFGLIGIRIASRPPDREHPYGHRKYETLFTIIIAAMIFLASFQILLRAYRSLAAESRASVDAGSFAVMVITLAVNIMVARYELRKGSRLGSDFLIADAMHTRSDILTSLAVIIGLVLTKLGYPHADAVAGIVVTGFIARIGFRIAKRASDVLVDTTRIDAKAICSVVKGIEGVIDCHDIRSRGTAEHISLDLHVLVRAELSVAQAHDIADEVEERLKEAFPSVADIVVHIEPDGGA